MGGEETLMSAVVERNGANWTVRIIGAAATQDYRCATEAMAAKFAAIFERAAIAVAA
jgi:hypothetical protein